MINATTWDHYKHEGETCYGIKNIWITDAKTNFGVGRGRHTLNPCGRRCCKKDQRQFKLGQCFFFVTTFKYITQQSTGFWSRNGNAYWGIFYILVRRTLRRYTQQAVHTELTTVRLKYRDKAWSLMLIRYKSAKWRKCDKSIFCNRGNHVCILTS